jgi:hypothetical protein
MLFHFDYLLYFMSILSIKLKQSFMIVPFEVIVTDCTVNNLNVFNKTLIIIENYNLLEFDSTVRD